MIISIGIDILRTQKKNNTKIKIFNDKEIKKKNILKIFTIKESIIKTLGTGFIYKFSIKTIKIIYNKFGKPYIIKKNKKIKFLISTSDEKNIIISIALIIKLNKFY